MASGRRKVNFAEIVFLCCAAIVEERLWEGAPAPESLLLVPRKRIVVPGRQGVMERRKFLMPGVFAACVCGVRAVNQWRQ